MPCTPILGTSTLVPVQVLLNSKRDQLTATAMTTQLPMLFCNFYYAEILRLPAIIFRKGKEGAPSASCTASRGTAAASGMVTPRHPHRAGVLVHLLDESFGEHVFNGFGEGLQGNGNDGDCRAAECCAGDLQRTARERGHQRASSCLTMGNSSCRGAWVTQTTSTNPLPPLLPSPSPFGAATHRSASRRARERS